MTFTKEKNETSPRWARDGSFFVFLSNREAPESAATRNQLYVMRPDGGEARRITDAKEGVSDFAFSDDGRWLVYRSGKTGEEQLYRLPGNVPDTAVAEQITKHPTGVRSWEWAPDARRIYFVTPDPIDDDEKARREKKFTVNIRNPETPVASLWALDLSTGNATKRLTEGALLGRRRRRSRTTASGSASAACRPIATSATSPQENIYADLYLLEAATGKIERLTNNAEVGESGLSFSPDSQQVAFSAPDDLETYSMSNARVYLRAIADRGKPFRKLGQTLRRRRHDQLLVEGRQHDLLQRGHQGDQPARLARHQVQHRAAADRREGQRVDRSGSTKTGVLLINYSDGTTPTTVFTVATIANASTRSAWKQLTDPNPQVRGFALGQQEEITWKSKDGTMVGGVLVKPVGYRAGQRYPLIVAIHGGPASADILGFNGGYGSQVYAGAGYVGAPAELSRLHQLRQQAQDRHRRQLLRARLRRHHDGRRSPDRAGHRRSAIAWARSAGAPAATGRTGS